MQHHAQSLPDTLRPVVRRVRADAVRSAVAGLAVIGLSLALVGCRSPRLSRDQVRDRWVDTYEQKLDLTRQQAECIVDRFLGETSDVVLAPLTKGQELSDAQAQRIGELAVACGVGPTS